MHTRVLIAASIVMTLTGALAATAWWYLNDWWQTPMKVTESAVIEVLPGDSAVSLARRLRLAGVVEYSFPLELMTRIKDQARMIQTGEFALNPGDTPEMLMQRILSGEAVEHPFTIIEGSTVGEVVANLDAAPKLIATLTPGELGSLRTLLGADAPDTAPEGWLFPDTYHYRKDHSDRSLLRRAYARMHAELDRAWNTRASSLPYEHPYQMLIVASLVEKETGHAADRKDIAQVFVRRLQKNMRLQTDPAVIYGLGEEFEGNLTRAHLKMDTPFNTYVHRGLPPTPIAMPGLSSLQAAAHPSGKPYLYFVARGDGTTHFSETLDEHNAAVRRYQLKRGDSR
ncbi:MAG: endolytic transglycosylase MltG [Pseudomonadales bacterium]|jgi:UPF0755 protein|nr:endolytic transglycosylase MltG [Pseudomonadales bacterium]MDP6472926.1 endolytic transglycosylase MltG [Pseudomonadales bacterium]MDP6826317.1 endolytic transglycosylase MltG [Pseudomonadales bacterium]MDP6972766.1 endolytic transglycosylase MltG [Pseudomonadales bacterium]|tara:strand:- start:1221 stop:2243 length:1023 start_codon:yes stop_codon:yes gene_type:complete